MKRMNLGGLVTFENYIQPLFKIEKIDKSILKICQQVKSDGDLNINLEF